MVLQNDSVRSVFKMERNYIVVLSIYSPIIVGQEIFQVAYRDPNTLWNICLFSEDVMEYWCIDLDLYIQKSFGDNYLKAEFVHYCFTLQVRRSISIYFQPINQEGVSLIRS